MSLPLTNAAVGDMSNTVTEYSVDTASTDGTGGVGETVWSNEDYSQQLGYFNNIPELNSTITTRAKWVIGKGYQADATTKELMSKWRGWGKDTANELIKNMSRTYNTGGDFYAEIIRDDSLFKRIFTWFGFVEKGKPVNLKPLDPATMSHIADENGMIKRYEQNGKEASKKTIPFKPEDMFHLARNRFADQIHGSGMISPIVNIIQTRNEAISDMKIVFHRYVKPLWIWKLNTDDETEIASFKAKADRTVEESENIYIPKDAAEAERASIPQYSTLDPLPWIRDQTSYFYQATNTPDVIVGSAKETVEASAKILFLGYEQSVRDEQLFIMENFKTQLGLDIVLEFPTPIEQELMATENKAGDKKAADTNDTKVNLKGKK